GLDAVPRGIRPADLSGGQTFDPRRRRRGRLFSICLRTIRQRLLPSIAPVPARRTGALQHLAARCSAQPLFGLAPQTVRPAPALSLKRAPLASGSGDIPAGARTRGYGARSL